MIRILLFLLVVFALGLGFAWLADRPGEMVVTFAGYQYQVSLMVAAVAITVIVAAVMITWWLIKSIWNSPYTIARYFRVRQYLAKAVRAPRDPAWVADGLVSERWAPVSPVTGKLDAFEWRVPVERLGQLIEQDDQARHPSLAPPRPQPAAAEDAETEDDAKPIDGTEVITAEPASDVSEAEIIEETAPRPPEPARLPDDPGVDPSQEQEQSERRFRLF